MGVGAPPRDKPLVLSARQANRQVLTAVDRPAAMQGLCPGQPLARARAMVPNLLVMEADPETDARALERLAFWAMCYSPLVAPCPPDGLWLDITGAAHLVGGEERLLQNLVDRLAAAGMEATAAVAETPGAAHALARHGCRRTLVVPPGDVALALAPLPLSALRLDDALVAGLKRLGFDSIGDLEAAPRAPLALRFGSEPGRRLDQAFGRAAEPLAPISPPELLQVRESFVEPLSTAPALSIAIARLVERLCARLVADGTGVRTLDLLFHRVDGTLQAVRAGTAEPVRAPARLCRLLGDRLDRVEPGWGVEAMTLSAPLVEPMGTVQIGSGLSGEVPDVNLAPLVETLASRIGLRRLYRTTPVDSDVPERSTRRVPPLALPTAPSWPAEWPRPARLLPRPEPVETVALLPDHPPVAFTWRGVRRRVHRADGPERIYGEWWRQDAELQAVRDYFAVEAETGERFWLYRSGDGSDCATGSMRWFLHGFFA